MAITFHTDLRNARGQVLIDFIGPDARLHLYTSGYSQQLVECVCDAEAFAPAPVSGTITANPIADGIAGATGQAALARLYQADGETLAMDGLVVTDTDGGGHVRLAQEGTLITASQTVIIDSLVLTEGNP